MVLLLPVVVMDGGLLSILSFLTLAVLGLLEGALFVEDRCWGREAEVVAVVEVEVEVVEVEVEVEMEEEVLLLFGR